MSWMPPSENVSHIFGRFLYDWLDHLRSLGHLGKTSLHHLVVMGLCMDLVGSVWIVVSVLCVLAMLVLSLSNDLGWTLIIRVTLSSVLCILRQSLLYLHVGLIVGLLRMHLWSNKV